MSHEAAARYVAAGAALLDEKGPEDWRERIRTHREALNMASTSACVLGLLYGSYFNGKDALGFYAVSPELYDRESWEYGFEHSIGQVGDAESEAGYPELTQAWLDEIEPAEDPNQDQDFGLI